MLSSEFDYILAKDTLQNPKDSSEVIEVGGKTSSSSLFRFCKQHNLGGLEFLRSLPGSVGGLVKMNAGMKQYEIKDTLLEVCIDGIWRSDFTLSYRSSDIAGIISAARFRLKKGFDSSLLEQFKAMRSTHPKEPSCGSCFKNPSGDYAGRLIEAVGLKGVEQNGVGFSPHHANFLVNFGVKSTQASPTKTNLVQADSTKTNFTKIDFYQAEFADALAMIELAKKRVKERFGIELVPEVQIVR
ncbi:UDP-N-acetylmuramate dehydrogenase [Helicobacter sp. MIT 01-3238]|nr:UDP-N-acetylmuramate dehydrogenase [Helicobacter sp. MIT 01-3238]